MSEPLFKAVFHYTWTSAVDRTRHWGQMNNQLSRWLRETGRAAHYVNRYINVNDRRGTSEMVVVLNDANTALMLKLALA